MTHLITNLIKSTLMTGLVGTILTQTACTQATTETKPSQEVSQPINALQISHVDAKGAQTLLTANPDTVVLDIRTPREIKNGYIKGAVFADFYDDDFAQQLTKLDKGAPYLVHCKGGGRSTKALTTMRELGFTNVTHLDGGLDGWKREQLPLTQK